MDNSQLWTCITEIQKHTAVMNGELGRAMADISWLKQSWWELMTWIRFIVGGVLVGILLSVWNLILIKKNGRKA
jgi:hypothetical protein